MAGTGQAPLRYLGFSSGPKVAIAFEQSTSETITPVDQGFELIVIPLRQYKSSASWTTCTLLNNFPISALCGAAPAQHRFVTACKIGNDYSTRLHDCSASYAAFEVIPQMPILSSAVALLLRIILTE